MVTLNIKDCYVTMVTLNIKDCYVTMVTLNIKDCYVQGVQPNFSEKCGNVGMAMKMWEFFLKCGNH